MKRALAIFAALGFVMFFITIVMIANRGQGGQWWGFIERIPYGDKLGHLGLTGTLSFLCNLAFPTPGKGKRILKFITFPTFVLGVFLTGEELSQFFIPSRTCDGVDWLADLIGLAFGQFVAHLAHTRRKCKPSKRSNPISI
jgi:VanZ family protein